MKSTEKNTFKFLTFHLQKLYNPLDCEHWFRICRDDLYPSAVQREYDFGSQKAEEEKKI